MNLHGTQKKSIYKNSTYEKIDNEKKKWMKSTRRTKAWQSHFWKINIFTFPRYYQIKNRFQICRQKQHGDPRRHPQTENRTSQQCVCAVVESLADAFVVMKSEEKQ